MRIVFVCLFALLTPLFGLHGQVLPKEKTLKWEVGTDLLWLVNKNILPRYSLMLRRNIGKYGAIRVRGGGDSYSSATTSYDGQDSKAYQVRAGYEYRTFLRDKRAYLLGVLAELCQRG